MPIRGPLIGPALRLRIGGSVLSAARVLDTRPVHARLLRFAREHRRYEEAQERVAACAQRLRAARVRLTQCDAELRTALRALAGALIGDGHPCRNTFAAFRGGSVSKLGRMAFTRKVDAVHALTAAVRNGPQVSRRTTRAGRLVDGAVRAVERAIVHLNDVETDARDARARRDAIGRGWHDAYAVLKLSARAAAEDVPGLHERLFPVARLAAKRGRRAVSTPRTATRQGASMDT